MNDSPAEALVAMHEMMVTVIEAVEGYRADLERRGWSPTVAEVMAMEYHQMLLRAMSR